MGGCYPNNWNGLKLKGKLLKMFLYNQNVNLSVYNVFRFTIKPYNMTIFVEKCYVGRPNISQHGLKVTSTLSPISLKALDEIFDPR